MASFGSAALRIIRRVRVPPPSSQLLLGVGVPWNGQGNISVVSSSAVYSPTLNHIPSTTLQILKKNGSMELSGLAALAAVATAGLVASHQSSAKCEGGEAELVSLDEPEPTPTLPPPNNPPSYGGTELATNTIENFRFDFIASLELRSDPYDEMELEERIKTFDEEMKEYLPPKWEHKVWITIVYCILSIKAKIITHFSSCLHSSSRFRSLSNCQPTWKVSSGS